MMSSNFPQFEKADVVGFTPVELEAVAEMTAHPGWAVLRRYLDAIMTPVTHAVFMNTDPNRQLLLHQGIGALYVAENVVEFATSAQAQADRLMQQTQSARDPAERAKDTAGAEA